MPSTLPLAKSASTWLLPLVTVILTNQLLMCGATFNVFISNSQLESYFQESLDSDLVRGNA